MLLRGMAMPFVFVSVQAAAFTNISSALTGRASSLFNTQRQVASACGVAVLATVLSTRAGVLTAAVAGQGAEAAQQATMTAFHDAFLAAVLFAVASLVFALRVPSPDSAASRRAGAAALADFEEPVLAA